VARLVERVGDTRAVVGIERSFLPQSMHERLARQLPHARLVDAAPVLEELRAVKRPHELELLRAASEEIVASMLATVRAAEPGVTTRQLRETMRREEVARGLEFEYLLAAAGPSLNRAPSDARWERGRVLSLDSGGQKGGYIGDLARMAVLGQPSAQMSEALAEIAAVQQAAREAVRSGTTGALIYEAAEDAVGRSPSGDRMAFVAHGMGLVSHEAPRLTDTGPVRYPATHRHRPLEPGMVLSIETDARIEGLGFVKLEDTVVVTETGHEAYGDDARDWIIVDA
jgi:Xaa-Pro aminopeptidase